MKTNVFIIPALLLSSIVKSATTEQPTPEVEVTAISNDDIIKIILLIVIVLCVCCTCIGVIATVISCFYCHKRKESQLIKLKSLLTDDMSSPNSPTTDENEKKHKQTFEVTEEEDDDTPNKRKHTKEIKKEIVIKLDKQKSIDNRSDFTDSQRSPFSKSDEYLGYDVNNNKNPPQNILKFEALRSESGQSSYAPSVAASQSHVSSQVSSHASSNYNKQDRAKSVSHGKQFAKRSERAKSYASSNNEIIGDTIVDYVNKENQQVEGGDTDEENNDDEDEEMLAAEELYIQPTQDKDTPNDGTKGTGNHRLPAYQVTKNQSV